MRNNSSSGSSKSTMLLLLGLMLLSCPLVRGLGGEKAVFELSQSSQSNQTETVPPPRQDICGRYTRVLEGNLTMRDALRGLELRPILRVGKFFRYREDTGIDALDPGIMALLLDELGRRAGFSWRNSFGVTYGPAPNTTFSDLLVWSVQNYDISINWWDQTLERMERGVSFVRPFFDGSLILIDKQDQSNDDNDGGIQWSNWLRPFTTEVWWVTIITIIISGGTYQWIEHLAGKYQRQRRTLWQGFCDGVYLSAINFPQNYEFQPTTAAGRIFGISISIWALVMTATYTANLASLLVDRKPALLASPQTMEDIVVRQLRVCTYANTGMDQFIQRQHRNVQRVPMPTELATYDALHEGQCDLTVAYQQNWLGFEKNRTFNPECDLAWVGRTIRRIESGFAVNADAGFLCSSLIRDVLNIYMEEMFSTDYIDDLWNEEYAKTQDQFCDDANDLSDQEPGESRDRRRLEEATQRQRRLDMLTTGKESTTGRFADGTRQRRRLKSGGRGAAAVGGIDSSEEGERLSLNAMAGTFFLHYACSIIAIAVGYLAQHRKKSVHLVKQSLNNISQKLKKVPSTTSLPDCSDPIGKLSRHGVDDDDDKDSLGCKEEPLGADAILSLQRTRQELETTQQELLQTSQKLDLIVSMLTDMQRRGETQDLF